jgi:hypothetical protein
MSVRNRISDVVVSVTLLCGGPDRGFKYPAPVGQHHHCLQVPTSWVRVDGGAIDPRQADRAICAGEAIGSIGPPAQYAQYGPPIVDFSPGSACASKGRQVWRLRPITAAVLGRKSRALRWRSPLPRFVAAETKTAEGAGAGGASAPPKATLDRSALLRPRGFRTWRAQVFGGGSDPTRAPMRAGTTIGRIEREGSEELTCERSRLRAWRAGSLQPKREQASTA